MRKKIKVIGRADGQPITDQCTWVLVEKAPVSKSGHAPDQPGRDQK